MIVFLHKPRLYTQFAPYGGRSQYVHVGGQMFGVNHHHNMGLRENMELIPYQSQPLTVRQDWTPVERPVRPPNATSATPVQGSGIEVQAPQVREARPQVSCLLYTSPSPRDGLLSRMPSSA